MPVIVRYYSSGSPSENNNTVPFRDSSVLVSATLEEQYSCFIFCLNECGLSISLFWIFQILAGEGMHNPMQVYSEGSILSSKGLTPRNLWIAFQPKMQQLQVRKSNHHKVIVEHNPLQNTHCSIQMYGVFQPKKQWPN